MGTEKRPGTMVYFSLLTPVEALNMEERGQLFTAILQYGSRGEEPAFTGMLHMAWLFVKRDMDQDKERYASRCEKSRKAAEARWKDQIAEEKPGMRSDANALEECERIHTDANDANTIQCNTNTTQSNTNTTQLNSLEGADAPAPRRQKKFIPPSVAEVEAYCNEKGYWLDARQFVDYYEASGWMRGKTKIKDWKACVRTWMKNDSGKPKKPQEELLCAANWED